MSGIIKQRRSNFGIWAQRKIMNYRDSCKRERRIMQKERFCRNKERPHCQGGSVQFTQSLSHVRLWPHGLQHARLPCLSLTPGAYANSSPTIHLILCHPLLLLPSVFPSIRVFSNESVLCIRWPKYWSFSFSISPSSEYSMISFRTDWSPCRPRDLKESSPVPQFKTMNSSVLSFLYGPTLTSIHDYWTNHSFD